MLAYETCARSQQLILALPDAQNTQKARYVGYFDRQIRSRRRSVCSSYVTHFCVI